MSINRFVFLLLLMPITAVSAQQSPSAPSPTSQQAEQANQNQALLRASLQVASMIDQGRIGDVWDGASSVAKQAVTRDAFVKQIDADRQILGAVTGRSFSRMGYSQSDGRKIPPGLYVNVIFATRFANTKQIVRELVSFHLDNDHIWRTSGYTVR
jgi:hypothetical protein